ncbi:MAG: ABC transporter ATP-binding protein, partial [Deltaproteobacteria bacterium]|nr:ABC transporter ATP-binding protein [Deltaproteobacteria bacterium]
NLMEGRTATAIAHRLSTSQDVDRIYVIHKGRIVEFGSHEELLGLEGVYYLLYRLQYRSEEPHAIAAG